MDKAKFPASLATYYLQSKTDLFQEWINCAEDWSKVELNYERRVTDKRQFKKSRKGMKPRDIIKQYGQEFLGVMIHYLLGGMCIFLLGHVLSLSACFFGICPIYQER